MLFGPIGSTPIGSSAAGVMAGISATAAGAVLVAAATIAAGSAAGTAAGTAPGATLRGTSSIIAGGATGTRSAAAPGASLAALSAIQAGAATGGAGGQTGGTGTATITAPASRTAKFAGSKRVAVFDGSGPVTLTKGALDEFFYASDISKDLTDAATTAESVIPVIPDLSGVTVLEGPVIQANLIVARLGGIGSITWRTTAANSEVFDHTLILKALDDSSHTFGKDPDDKRFFALDFSEDAAAWLTSLTPTQLPPVVAGVTSLAAPTTQGNQAIVKIGGLDTAGVNSCTLTALLANGEKLVRAIYFAREDH